jgi:hypothetical protein
MIVVVKDATFMWEKDAILMWAVRPDVHHDAACCGFHRLIVHPDSFVCRVEHGIKINQTITLSFVMSLLTP